MHLAISLIFGLICVLNLARPQELTKDQKFDYLHTLQGLTSRIDVVDKIGKNPSSYIEKYKTDPVFRQVVDSQVTRFIENSNLDPADKEKISELSRNIQNSVQENPSTLEDIGEILTLLSAAAGIRM